MPKSNAIKRSKGSILVPSSPPAGGAVQPLISARVRTSPTMEAEFKILFFFNFPPLSVYAVRFKPAL